jgi:hypothetical protein
MVVTSTFEHADRLRSYDLLAGLYDIEPPGPTA